MSVFCYIDTFILIVSHIEIWYDIDNNKCEMSQKIRRHGYEVRYALSCERRLHRQ